MGITLIAVTVGSFALSWAVSNGRSGALPIEVLTDKFAFYSSITRAWEFAAGGLVALWASLIAARTPTRLASGVGTAGLALVAWAAVNFDESTIFPGVAALLPVAGGSLVILAGEISGTNPLSSIVAIRPLQLLGDLSYSWYLWHWPFIVFAVTLWPAAPAVKVLAAIASLIPSWASYRYVENPIRFKPSVPPGTTLRLAAICMMVPLIAAMALAGGHRMLTRTDAIAEGTDAFRKHADVQRGCDDATPLSEREQPDCTWVSETRTGRALLVGDSNAGQFTEGFTSAANETGLDATVATQSVCPIVDLIVIVNGDQNDTCRRFVVDVVSPGSAVDGHTLTSFSGSELA